jgi:membrane protein YdbS with pleckstrin-like domain
MSDPYQYQKFLTDPSEKIINLVRQSKLIIINQSIIPASLIILPFFFLYPLFAWARYGIIIFFASILIGLIWLIRNILIWSKRVFIITDRQIIDIDQAGLFKKIVSSIALTKIQDVYYEVKGLSQTFGKLGNVAIIINDNKTKIEIDNIKQPEAVQRLIFSLKSKINNDSAPELINLIKKIKDALGPEKFNEIAGLAEFNKIDH